MSIGWAKRISTEDKIALAKAQGFEAVEPALSAIMELDNAGSVSFHEKLEDAGLSCGVFESILPADVRVTERGFNIYSWSEYLKQALARASMLGCKTLVWGDGNARILPIEGETSILKEHFNQFLFMLCDLAGQHGIGVCLEPLGSRRTNFLNSLHEVAGTIDSIGKPNLAIALSSADVVEIGIPDEELIQYGSHIIHAQVEKPRGQADASFDYLPFFTSLEKISYRGMIALPGSADGESLKQCKESWEKAAHSR